MKKKAGIIILAAAMCFSSYAQCFAGEQENGISTQYEDISPYYANIKTIYYDLTVSSSGKAVYTIDVMTLSASKIKVSVKLQEKIDGSWTTIDTDSFTEYDKDMLDEGISYVDDSNGIYRAVFTITVTYDGGSETVTKTAYN